MKARERLRAQEPAMSNNSQGVLCKMTYFDHGFRFAEFLQRFA